jgi:hypothetical protein
MKDECLNYKFTYDTHLPINRLVVKVADSFFFVFYLYFFRGSRKNYENWESSLWGWSINWWCRCLYFFFFLLNFFCRILVHIYFKLIQQGIILNIMPKLLELGPKELRHILNDITNHLRMVFCLVCF